MKFKINKKEGLISVEFPPVKRNIRVYTDQVYLLSFPEHQFIAPIDNNGDYFQVAGLYPIKMVLKKRNKFYIPPLGDGKEDGSVCISERHAPIIGKFVDKVLLEAIEVYWAGRFPFSPEEWLRATKKDICIAHKFQEIKGIPKFEPISIESLRKEVKKKVYSKMNHPWRNDNR